MCRDGADPGDGAAAKVCHQLGVARQRQLLKVSLRPQLAAVLLVLHPAAAEAQRLPHRHLRAPGQSTAGGEDKAGRKSVGCRWEEAETRVQVERESGQARMVSIRQRTCGKLPTTVMIGLAALRLPLLLLLGLLLLALLALLALAASCRRSTV